MGVLEKNIEVQIDCPVAGYVATEWMWVVSCDSVAGYEVGPPNCGVFCNCAPQCKTLTMRSNKKAKMKFRRREQVNSLFPLPTAAIRRCGARDICMCTYRLSFRVEVRFASPGAQSTMNLQAISRDMRDLPSSGKRASRSLALKP